MDVRDSEAVSTGGLFVFLATSLLLSPVEGVFAVLPSRPESLLLVGVFVACIALVGVFSALTGTRVAHLLTGGLVVYVIWLCYLEITAGPFDSPVHVLLGIAYLIGFGIGAGLVERAERAEIVSRLSVLE